MSIGKRKAKQIAKMYVSGLITFYDGFYSDVLNEDDNNLVHEECLKIALKLYDGKALPSTDSVVESVINK